ncbi:MAG: sensor histidine kinase [Streptococcus sp.]|nr:sensor histidine kinase [Streptococcus sp.]
MDMQSKIFFFKRYIYSKRFILVLLSSILFMIFLFSFLFEDSYVVLSYLAVLFLFLSTIFLFIDCGISYQSYRKQVLYDSGEAETALESWLKEKNEELLLEKKNRAMIEQEKQNDLFDYYTLWAHQIKTPIAASSLLIGDLENHTIKKQLEQEMFKIDSYVNLVLQYLRLESFHKDLVVHGENLEDMVKEVVKKQAIFFIQKNLSLNLHDLDYEVITDKKWLTVILEQILSNSLKYTSKGEIEIYFKKDTLYMKDTGLGIQDADILRVFERGFSGYNGRLTQQSSGLGLYLSKKIADQLGHELTLESTLGQGTTVKIRFFKEKLILD